MNKNPYKPSLYETNKAKNSIYIPQPSQYGYLIRVNHPEILPYYEAYKEMIGEPKHFTISRDERLGFEHLVLCGYYPEIKLKRA